MVCLCKSTPPTYPGETIHGGVWCVVIGGAEIVCGDAPPGFQPVVQSTGARGTGKEMQLIPFNSIRVD